MQLPDNPLDILLRATSMFIKCSLVAFGYICLYFKKKKKKLLERLTNKPLVNQWILNLFELYHDNSLVLFVTNISLNIKFETLRINLFFFLFLIYHKILIETSKCLNLEWLGGLRFFRKCIFWRDDETLLFCDS